jgi:hypothetical protein
MMRRKEEKREPRELRGTTIILAGITLGWLRRGGVQN